jgi:putative addiction module component (TIGR02574 family)
VSAKRIVLDARIEARENAFGTVFLKYEHLISDGWRRELYDKSMKTLPDEIRQLSVPERLQLLEDIWDSVLEDERDLPGLTDAQKTELDRRVAAHDADPTRAIPWSEARARLNAF